MKKVFLIIVLVFGFNSFAQDQVESLEKIDKKTTEQKTEYQLKKLTSDLNLNENQVNDVRTVLSSAANVREAKMAEIKVKRIDGNRLSKEDRRGLMSEMKEVQKNVSDKMKQILTPDQFAKWEKIQEERKDKMREKMKEKKQ